MNLCSDGHDEVCYEGKYCPACYLKKEFNDRIIELEDKINEENEYSLSLEQQIKELEIKHGKN
jgi:hypothetical protein